VALAVLGVALSLATWLEVRPKHVKRWLVGFLDICVSSGRLSRACPVVAGRPSWTTSSHPSDVGFGCCGICCSAYMAPTTEGLGLPWPLGCLGVGHNRRQARSSNLPKPEPGQTHVHASRHYLPRSVSLPSCSTSRRLSPKV